MMMLWILLGAGAMDAQMVEYPAATYQMGHPTQEMGPYGNSWKSNELPPHSVSLSPFALDRTEVTAGAWVDFLNAHLEGAPEAAVHHHPLQPARWTGGLFEVRGDPDAPARMVSWYDAVTYCAWQERRLPTEAEWERAAKSTEDENQGYPWGTDRPGCTEAVFFTNRSLCAAEPQPVGSRSPDGDSAEGVADLSGNVAEWVWDGYAPYTEEAQTDPVGPDEAADRVVRGGGYRDSSDMLRSMARIGVAPHTRSEGIGFRCASSL
jgi:formylglycine-generating enzyme required for sulfatase activity